MNARRVYAPAKNQIDLEPFTLPTLKPDEVMLESLYTTISPGTELAWLQHQASTPGVYPWYPGYSGTARVIKLGAAVSTFKVGQVVACNMPHSSHCVVRANTCHPLPDTADLQDASAFRLISIALQGVRKAQIQLGEKVCVMGLGPIGNLAAQLARASGAFVTGTELLEYRKNLALELGFNAVTNANNNSFDVVIEATGVPKVIQASFKLAKQRGRVILLGSPRGLSDGVDFYVDVHKKGLNIVGAHEINRSAHNDLEQTDYQDEAIGLELLAAKRLDMRSLISDVISPEQTASAYRRLAKRKEDLMLVTINWQQSA